MSLKVRLFNQPQDASRAMPSSTSFYRTTRGYCYKIQSEGPREKYPLNSIFPKTVLKGTIQHSRVSETYFTELKEVLSTHVSYYLNLKSKAMD